MIDELVNLKESIEKSDENQIFYRIGTTISGFLILTYSVSFIVLHDETNILLSVAYYLFNLFHIILISIPPFFFVMFQSSKSSGRKEKKHFENLRIELIDHLNSKWFKNKHSPYRDAISIYLESYNIDVRYKSNATYPSANQ